MTIVDLPSCSEVFSVAMARKKENEELFAIKEDLIGLVQSYPNVWLTSHPDNVDRSKVTNAWLDIYGKLKGRLILKKTPIFGPQGQVALPPPPHPLGPPLTDLCFALREYWCSTLVLNSLCGQSSLGPRGRTSLGVCWVNSPAKV